MKLSRRWFLAHAAAGGAAHSPAKDAARAQTADFPLKFGNDLPVDHPVNGRLREAIGKATGGAVAVELVPNNQLGSDSDMLTQVRSGALELATFPGTVMSTLVPAMSIAGVGLAFPDYKAVWSALQMAEHLGPKPRVRTLPDPAQVARAVEILWSARRLLVVSGRGARGAGAELVALLDRLGAVYLDTGESRGLVPDSHPSVVAAMRGAVMGDADVALTVGRRLDFQLAFGSPAVFGAARFVRIADVPGELRDNRRGEVELAASPAEALKALVEAAGNRESAVDRAWAASLRQEHLRRAQKLREGLGGTPNGADGRLHPNRVLGALQEAIGDDAVVINDGGDFLAFGRVAMSAPDMLDPGPFGCIGVGVPYGIAASLAFPGRDVVVATGDGAFGFHAMEIDTAVRHKAPALFVVANNGAWQIEVHDQTVTHGKVVGTRLRHSDYAAMARAFGMHAERVEREEELKPAIARALANRPALVDVVVTSDAVSSDGRTGLAWVPDLQPLAAWDEAERRWRASGDR